MARSAEGWRLRRDERTGVWFVRFRVSTRRVHRSTGERDHRKAQARAREIFIEEHGAPQRAHAARARSTLALDVLIGEWLVALTDDGRAPETIETYTTYARAHWLPRWTTLGDLTEASIADYRRARLKLVLGRTVAKELSALSSFFAWCCEREHVAVPPRIVFPKAHHGTRAAIRKDKALAFPRAIIDAILEHLPERADRRTQKGTGHPRAYYVLAAETGLRHATLARLEAPRNYRKGATSLELHAKADKARYGRKLDLTERAREALDAVVPEVGKLFGRARLARYLKAAAVAAGLPPELASQVSDHDLRASYATDEANKPGVSLAELAFRLGHKSITTTARYVRPEVAAEAARMAANAEPFGTRNGTPNETPVEVASSPIVGSPTDTDQCEERDSNSHAFRRWNLNPIRNDGPRETPEKKARPASRLRRRASRNVVLRPHAGRGVPTECDEGAALLTLAIAADPARGAR